MGGKKGKKNKWERRLCVRERELRGRETEKGMKLLYQFVVGRKEKKGKKERKGKEKRKKKKRKGRKPDQHRAVVGPDMLGTELR